MPAQWTADLIGKMHLHKITAKELSAELGKHPKYVSQIMNGHRLPKKSEEEFNLALDRLIEKKGGQDGENKNRPRGRNSGTV